MKGLLYLEETEHKNYASALKDQKFLVYELDLYIESLFYKSCQEQDGSTYRLLVYNLFHIVLKMWVNAGVNIILSIPIHLQ